MREEKKQIVFLCDDEIEERAIANVLARRNVENDKSTRDAVVENCVLAQHSKYKL